MRLAVVLVHYHTPRLAAEAVAALRADLFDPDQGVEWLLVDNGSDADGGAFLDRLPLRRLTPERNLGFAGGVNLGLAQTRAEQVLVLNPDVLVLPGCTTRLLQALDSGAGVAGPRFFWDRGRRLRLPPADRVGRADELVRWLGERGEVPAQRARQRWRRHARRHWSTDAPLASHSLSGSLLALSRRAWDRVGPFDESYALYFEETDWLERARRCGVAGAFVPGAEAIHLHAQSARQEPLSGSWFEASAQRFYRRAYGAWFLAALRALSRIVPVCRPGPLPAAPGDEVRIDPPERGHGWLELSPLARGFPAAGEPLASGAEHWRLPAELRARLAQDDLFATRSDAVGHEMGRWRLPPAS